MRDQAGVRRRLCHLGSGCHQHADADGAGVFGLGADAHRCEHSGARLARSKWGVLHELPDQRALVASVLDRAARGVLRRGRSRSHRAALASFRGGRRAPPIVQIPLDLLPQRQACRPSALTCAAAPPRRATAGDRKGGALSARRTASTDHRRRRSKAQQGRAPRQLIEALDCFLVTTAAGKGRLPEDHPANLGASLPYP